MASLHAQQPVYGGAGPDWWTAGLDSILPREDDYNNAAGRVRMVLPNGMVHTKGHPFFEALGSNGRACITCHQPSNGMSVSAAGLHQRWSETDGKDAVFAAVDGSNCPDLPQNSRSSHSLLLDRGLFRIALPWPPRDAEGKAITPEFRIEVVSDLWPEERASGRVGVSAAESGCESEVCCSGTRGTGFHGRWPRNDAARAGHQRGDDARSGGCADGATTSANRRIRIADLYCAGIGYRRRVTQ